MIKPILEQEFKPAIIELRNFINDVAKSEGKQKLYLAIERNDGYVYRRDFDIFLEGVDDKRNTFIIERFIKCVLWVVGGYKIYLSGSKKVYEDIRSYYQDGGLREFDYNFMSTVFERPFEVVYIEDEKEQLKQVGI